VTFYEIINFKIDQFCIFCYAILVVDANGKITIVNDDDFVKSHATILSLNS